MLKLAFIFFLLLSTSVNSETWYVSKAGSDGNDGKGAGASNALLTIGVLLDSLGGGDTAFFGAGIWREAISYTPSGTFSDRTAYIDSAWYDSPGTRAAWIYGSDLLSGNNNWELVSGNVYRRFYSGTITNTSPMFQSNSLIWRQSSLGAVDDEGEWYWNGTDSMYLYAVGGGDPDNYEIEYANRDWVRVAGNASVGSDYVSIYGLGFKYARSRGISLDGTSMHDSEACDSVFIDHCFLSHLAGQGNENPSIIFSGQTSVSGTYNRIRACSLSNAWAMNPETLQPYGGASWGAGVAIYALSHTTIDSNTVYGYFTNSGIYFKGQTVGIPWKDSNIIAFNKISVNSTAIRLLSELRWTEIYGNEITGASTGLVFQWGAPASGIGFGRAFNNTFTDCAAAIDHYNVEGDALPYYGMSRDDEFKYNVIVNSGNTSIALDSLPQNGGISLDYNLYDVGGTLTLRQHPLLWYGAGSGGYNTVSEWQALGYDVNSEFVSGVAGSMDTTYGGRHWSAWGAVQIDATTPEIGITVSGGGLQFAAVYGLSSAVDQTFLISNAGIGTLNWQVTDDASWLTITPNSGTGTTTLTASVSAQPIDSYTAEITITAAGASNSPRYINVNYDVVEPDVTPPVISFLVLSSSFNTNIVWLTDEPATSKVEYGFTTAYGEITEVQAFTTYHSVWLTNLTADTVYHFRVSSVDTAGNEAISLDSTFRTPVQPDNLALGHVVTVSGTYAGYSSNVINDGIIDASGGTSTTWASSESADHWVEIDLQQNVPVSSVRIFWAYNSGSSTWMRSQLFTIEGWDGSGWVEVATIDNIVDEIISYPDTIITYEVDGTPNGFSITRIPADDDQTISEAGFDTITISKLRIVQQGNMGPTSYPSIMWLTEIEVFADDIIPPSSKL